MGLSGISNRKLPLLHQPQCDSGMPYYFYSIWEMGNEKLEFTGFMVSRIGSCELCPAWSRLLLCTYLHYSNAFLMQWRLAALPPILPKNFPGFQYLRISLWLVPLEGRILSIKRNWGLGRRHGHGYRRKSNSSGSRQNYALHRTDHALNPKHTHR